MTDMPTKTAQPPFAAGDLRSFVRARIGKEQVTDDDADIDFGELQIADYIVFLLAFDTYMRWMKEQERGSEDPVFSRGMALLRNVERQHLARIGEFLRAGIANPGSLKSLENALKLPPTARGASVRALRLRTVLSRGGSATAKHVFGKSIRARKEVTDAIESSMIEEASAAVGKLALITLRDKRLEQWIDRAAAASASGGEPRVESNPVHEASKRVGEDANELLSAKVTQEAASPASDVHADAQKSQAATLQNVETKATEAAAKSLVKSGTPDVPPTRSEVIGIATAAATAAIADQASIPPSLRPISDDPEKMEAVMTDGRVLLAAGAGSGKTMALVSRIAYLIQERHVSPSRIFAVVFNVKASTEIAERLAGLIGDDALSKMTQGTMHAIFRKFIMQYGNAEQKGALTSWFSASKDKNQSTPTEDAGLSRVPSPSSMAGYMTRCWKACYQTDPPSGGGTAIGSWMMNDIDPAQAKVEAIGENEEALAEWYEWKLGFKRVLKNWQPPCTRTNAEANKHWMGWLNKIGGGRNRLGDFDDMIIMFRDVLRDNVPARKAIQDMFDHICVDEAQDLNSVQHQIIDMMGEQVTNGQNGKSLWIVGDEIQSINAFTGARPELFTQYHGMTDPKTGAVWQTRFISTNYRCLPEIVETANQMMTEHPRGIPMEAKPHGAKPRGQASIVLSTPQSHASGALGTITDVAQKIELGESPSDFAVLTRTNKELNDFETACIVSGTPYSRKGGSSFLKSPETLAVVSYLDLVTGTDYTKMQDALGVIINKPQRFFGMSPDQASSVVRAAIDTRARKLGVSRQNVNPLDLLDPSGIADICQAAGIYEGWKIQAQRRVLTDLQQHLLGIKDQIERSAEVRAQNAADPSKPPSTEPLYSTTNVIHDILAITGMPEQRGKPPMRLRDDLLPVWMMQDGEEDAPKEEGEEDKKPVGNVEFLLHMAQPTNLRKDRDPSDPIQFKAYLDKLAEDAKDLRVDTKEWDRTQKREHKDPKERLPAPCVTLSTVHSMKGAQYKNVTVVMPEGTFPMTPRKIEGEDTLPPEKQAKLAERRERDFLTERQLAYVALTRAKSDLTVMCPKTDRFGRPSGPSIFVSEAGLKPGQNVAGQAEPAPEDPALIKTALSLSMSEPWDTDLIDESTFEPEPGGDTWLDDEPVSPASELPTARLASSYDRRGL